ncbi:hypothetical protein ABII15_34255 [Streptomyces sp. HUAS MG91]|uniref:Ig-like domain-containing protein n=1 Tax=Streptomyces tabacisoli TaxID=3156398 RepID=A0AAU8J1B9_9ACTN
MADEQQWNHSSPSPQGWQVPPGAAGRQAPPQKKQPNKWKIGCLGCGGLIVLIGIIITIVLVTSVNHEANKKVKIVYKVTGSAENVSVTYSSWRDGDWSTSQSDVKRLPWTKEQETSGLLRGGSLTVTTGASGGTATCSVSVDDGKPKTATASGTYATADCNGFGD